MRAKDRVRFSCGNGGCSIACFIGNSGRRKVSFYRFCGRPIRFCAVRRFVGGTGVNGRLLGSV